jgi:hypothetical protein
MRGPYRLADTEVSRSRYPAARYFKEASEHQFKGIYLQVVQLPASYRVAYVGETDAKFVRRQSDSVKAYCDPPFTDTCAWQLAACKKFDEVLELYPPLFRMGIRAYIRIAEDNTEQRCRLRKEALDDSLIFFGKLSADDIPRRRSIEAAIVRHLKGHFHQKSYPPGVAEFLYNELGGLQGRFDGTIQIEAPAVIEGLEEPFQDPSL